MTSHWGRFNVWAGPQLGANERKCGDAVIGGDASCTDQINVAPSRLDVLAVVDGRKKRRKEKTTSA